MMEKKVIRAVFCLGLLAAALAGCSNDGAPSFNQTNTITGTVSAPSGDSQQFASVQAGGFFSGLASFVFSSVFADITGLTPVAGATVELVRVSNGVVLDTKTTDQNGAYTFTNTPTIGPGSAFVVRVTGQTDTMRAIVTGEVVDISPATEVVTDAVISSLGGGTALANFMVQEVAALNGLLVSMDTDVTGMNFGAAVQAIRTAAGPLFPDLVAAYSTPGTETALHSSNYAVVDYAGPLRDPLIVPAVGAKGGVELDSGQGTMNFGSTSDAPTLGLVAIGKFLHDFTSAQDLRAPTTEDAFPYTLILNDLLHVVNARHQVVIADSIHPSESAAGIGAITASGTLMVYPLDNSVRIGDALSVSGMGIRFAARWPQPVGTQPLLDLTLLDAPGGAGTIYNQVRLQQTLAGEGSGANTVTLTTEVGTATFDSTPVFHDFDQPKAYGGFVSHTVTDNLQLDLADYAVTTGSGSDVLNGLYYVPPNGGLVQFRDATTAGTLLGWGATSSDGERDGEIIGANMFSGGFADPVTTVERSFSVAIRRASGMASGDALGTYNVVEYAGYLSNDLVADPPTAFVGTGIRYGTVSLNGAGGVTSGTLFHKRATLDVAAATGKTGAVPNASGASGNFAVAKAGAAGETFSLTVGGVTVFTFTSTLAGDTVIAADIQGGLDNATVQSNLAAAGFTVSGTVAGGTLVFTKTDGAVFDIVVVNTFTGTMSAAGGFSGADFTTGTHTINNAPAAVPTVSGASDTFTTATAGAAGETFALSVGGVTVFTFTSTAAGNTVTAAAIQGGLDNLTVQSDLAAAGITFIGSVAGGNLVFTKADGTDFTIVVTNGFTGTVGAAGGFAGANFATGAHTISNGTEAAPAVPNASGTSGTFTTATAGDAGQTFSLTVGGVPVFTFTSAAAGDTVEAAAIQGGLASASAALTAAGITVSGTVAGGNLVFTKTDGAAFTIVVINGFSGTVGTAGGFAGAHFATGARTISNGTELVANASGTSGTFTTATAGDAGQTFSLTVGGVPVFTFTSAAAGDTVEAAAIQGGLASASAALTAAGITVSGTVAGGNLVFTKTDGAAFTIVVINGFSGTVGAAGGFAGANFATGAHTISNGTEAAPAVPNASGTSGTFTTATAGDAGQTFSLTVGGVPVFTFTSAAAGDTVEAAAIQGGLASASAALTAAGITVSGTVAGGNLVFTKTDGAAFTIVVINGFSGTVGAAGGFAGANFATGAHTISNGTEAAPAVPNASGTSGTFTTATAGDAGQTFSLTVGGVPVFTFTSAAAGDTVEAAAIQDGLASASAALTAAGITVSGTVAGGNLVFTRTNGTSFVIEVANTFTTGGFAGADFATGTHTINNGSEAVAAVPTVSDPSGAFTTATAVAAGQTYSLTVGGVPVFTFTSAAAGDTVTAAAIQGGLTNASAALTAAGITVSGTVAGGNLVFTKADGTDFTIVVTNTFTNTTNSAGGFAGANFLAGGPHTINNGSEAVAAVPTVSDPSGAFTTATAVAAGQTYSLTVGGVPVFTFTSAAAGDTVTATAIQGGLTNASAALTAAGITVSGTVAGGNLVFTKADGTDFTIVVTNTFTNTTNSAGGFAGANFLAGGPHTINNGSELVATVSDPSGAFTTATAVAAGQTYSLTVGGVPVFTFTSAAAGDTVTATAIQGGLTNASAALTAAGITVSGTVAGGNLVFTKADGTDFTIVVTNTFTNTTNSAGGFAGADFLATGPHTINNGSEAVAAVPTVSDPSGAFTTATAVAAGQTYSLTVGGVPVFTFTSAAAGDTVTAAAIQGGLTNASAALTAAGITVSGTVAGGNLVFTKADGTDFTIVVTNTFTNTTNSAGGFAGTDFALGPNDITNGTPVGSSVSGASGAFTTATAGAAGETFSLSVGGVTVFTFTSIAAGDTVTAADIQSGLDNLTVQSNLAAAGIAVSGAVATGDLSFTKADGAAFDIVMTNEFTGTASAAGGFAGADFAIGTQTINNGTLAGPAPSLSSISGQQSVSSGSYNVLANGEMTLTLNIGDEIVTGSGAVAQSGDFIALAIGSDDGTRKGRGILFLIRQP